ncbi:ribosomal subunit interface protein [Acidithiobacillus marinus]|uniref:Ribosome hibernation promoting factor n=1 Tax=Acidithiobacillus marinus TaxID=187490 RepID=A0A2I1DQS9_9PROT|nr:ribosome-associated translation inhibitor RaiA [Acidithiobacillus marinus]PKY12241.1 ribosomal subunit interface protein [Acidithiobacillus marinus]
MQITITGQHLDLTEALKNHTEEKIGKLDRHFDQVIDARVVLKHAPHENPENTADVTMYAAGHVFHAESRHADMYRALDMVTEKLESQIDSYKEKRQDRRNDHSADLAVIAETE